MKLAYPAFALAKASAKGKCCERRRRSRAQCLSACTGVVDLYLPLPCSSSVLMNRKYKELLSFLKKWRYNGATLKKLQRCAYGIYQSNK